MVDTRAQQQTDPICALTGLSSERQRMARQEIDRDATVLERMMGGDGVGSRHGKCHRLSRDDAEAELYQARQPIRELWAAGSSRQTV